MFNTFVHVLYVLAKNPGGLTVGQVAKNINGMTIRKAQKLLDDLKTGRYVVAEMQPHGRTGKRVFTLCQRARRDFAELAVTGLDKAVQA